MFSITFLDYEAFPLFVKILMLLLFLAIIYKTLPFFLKTILYQIHLYYLSSSIRTDKNPRFLTNRTGEVIRKNAAGKDLLNDSKLFDFFSSRYISENHKKDLLFKLKKALDTGYSSQTLIDVNEDGRGNRWFEIVFEPVKFLKGLVICSFHDVTSKRIVEEILTHEHKHFSDFLDLLPIGVYSIDSSGQFCYANEKITQWLSVSYEEICSSNIETFLDKSYKADLKEEYNKFVTFRTADGERFEAVIFQTIFDDAGIMRSRTAVFRNPEETLVKNHANQIQKFYSFFDSVPIAMAIIDSEGFVNECNQKFSSILEISHDKVLGSPINGYLKALDKKPLLDKLEDIFTGSRDSIYFDSNLFISSSDQKQIEVSVFAGVFPSNIEKDEDYLEGAILHIIDISDKKSLELQFAQSQKMQAMGQLAGGIAHDFNNLLTAIIGFSDFLLERHSGGDPSFSDIMQIRQNANRAANLVRQLLAFSRKQPLKPIAINCTDQLTELSHLLNRLIGSSIKLKFDHGSNLGLVEVDPVQFDQMIINLALNARDAMQEGGILSITTKNELLSEPTDIGIETIPAGNYLQILVSDTGKGISEGNLDRIFEPFFTTKMDTPGAGTGLGLATVYGIVRQTGGFIRVESKLDQGSKFFIFLPAKDRSLYNVKPSVPSDSSLQKQDYTSSKKSILDPIQDTILQKDFGNVKLPNLSSNILLVEDEDAVRIFAVRALKNIGLNVLEARTAEQAIEIIDDNDGALSLLITDMMLPGMDGFSLARRVIDSNNSTKIILISGYDPDTSNRDIFEIPQIEFLPKPFSLSQLITKVEDVLSKK